MAHIAILGAGLGGMPMAYEMQEQLRPGDRITVIGNGPNSTSCRRTRGSPCAGARARTSSSRGPYLAKKGIAYNPAGAKRVHRTGTRSSSTTGRRSTTTISSSRRGRSSRSTRSRVSAAGAHAVGLPRRHAERAADAWDAFVADPGPIVVGAVQGASCFGPRTSSRSSWKRTCGGGRSATASR